MGKAAGVGEGQGEGRGADSGAVCAGSAVAVAFTVIMCLCGVPMMITGAVFIALYNNPLATWQTGFDIGVALLVISLLMLVGGIVLIALICSGKCGSRDVQPQQTVVVVTQTAPRRDSSSSSDEDKKKKDKH